MRICAVAGITVTPAERGDSRAHAADRGSSAASSTSPTTASTATSRPATASKVALHWEGEPGDTRTITYADLQREVCKAANALTELGVRAGDRVAIYLPMIPEAVISMLACARIGATAQRRLRRVLRRALKARIEDAEAKLLITTDGSSGAASPRR